MTARDLMKHLAPPDLVTSALGPSQQFLSLYGESPLLCIELRDSSGGELQAGLAACVNPNEGGGARAGLGFHTEVAAEPITREAMGNYAFSASELSSRLLKSQHFALPLVKRSQGTMSELRISVGRARNTDVVMRDGSVSKFHAWFEIDDGGTIRLADAGSKNGTMLRGEPLPARELQEVRYGEPIVFGAVHAFLCEPPALWEAFHLG